MKDEASQPGVKSRKNLYAYASKYSEEAIDMLYSLMKTSRNEGIQLGAAKALLNKTLPDLRTSEQQIEERIPIPILGGLSAD